VGVKPAAQNPENSLSYSISGCVRTADIQIHVSAK